MTRTTTCADEPTEPSLRYRQTSWAFAIAFSLLISHELDAMIREEWLLLPGFGGVSSESAADVFNLLHVPLFAIIIWGLCSGSPRRTYRTMLTVEVFVIGHAIAHTVFRSNVDYRFEAPVETITVYGAAAFALLHLVSGLLRRRSV